MTSLTVEEVFAFRRDGLTMAQIARRNGISLSTLYRLLRDTPETAPASTTDVYAALEVDLCARYLLSSARVIGNLAQRGGPGGVDDDEVARAVGIRAAGEVTVNNGETLGVGCGRTVMFACQSFAARAGIATGRADQADVDADLASLAPPARNLRVVSLSPGRAVYPCVTSEPKLVAANDAATFAAFGFGTAEVVTPRGGAVSDEREKDQIRYGTGDVPDVNLVGLGSLADDAPKFFARLWIDLSPELRRLVGEIVAAANRIRVHVAADTDSATTLKFYSPLLEVLNRLELVPLPAEHECDRCQSACSELASLLEKWNSRARSMPLEKLNFARHTVVAAGGAYKAFAIEHMLRGVLRTPSRPWQVTLVTDVRAATLLLDISAR